MINLAFVPLLISYLGKQKYGIWLTISALISWMQMFDLGLGNGLKIKLTEAFSKKKIHEIKLLINAAYYFISLISIILITIFLVSNNFIAWEVVLGLSKSFNGEYSMALNIIILSFLFLLIIKLVGVVYASLQLPYVDNLIKTISQIVFFLLVLFFYFLHLKPSLIKISFAAVIPLVLIYSSFNIYLFFKKAPGLFPRLTNFSKETLKSIVYPGLSFFFIQISMVVLYSTDNVIIIKLISPEAVTNYNIAYKYFSLPFVVFTLYISTHWPAFIDALAKKDYPWIRKKTKIFNMLFILLILSYIFMFIIYNNVVALWIGKANIVIDPRLNIAMVVYFLISSYATIYTYLINASGKLRIQMLAYIIIAVINIPMSIFIVKQFNVGSAGVIMASGICLLLLLIFLPIQYFKLVRERAIGIWNK